MFMDPSDIQQYPKSARLLQNIDHFLKGKPKVMTAFLQACTADNQTQSPAVARKLALEKALKWGTGPRVDVAVGLIRAPAGGETTDACGFQPGFGSGQVIMITSYWFDAYEFGIDADRDNNANRLTRTLLHEAVHWVRQEAHAEDLVRIGGLYRGQDFEAGRAFEQWAYGNPNVCTQSQIDDAVLSRRI